MSTCLQFPRGWVAKIRYGFPHLFILLFVVLVAGCGGGTVSNIQGNFKAGQNVGSGCTTANPNQSCSPPGSGGDTSTATQIITSTNYQAIANRVAYDLDSVLRQRPGLPPTLSDTIASLLRKVEVSLINPGLVHICSGAPSTPDPITITNNGAFSFTVELNGCQMQSDQAYALTGSFDIKNYDGHGLNGAGSSPWIGSVDLQNIDLTYTLSSNQNLKFDGKLSYATQVDGTTQVLTRTITPNNLRVIKETSNATGGTDTSYNTFTSGTLTNATDPSTNEQTLTITAGYFNASISGEQLDIPQSLLVWSGNFDNPSAPTSGSGALQVTDSTGGSALLMTPVDETRMDLTLNGASLVCIGWVELAPSGCS